MREPIPQRLGRQPRAMHLVRGQSSQLEVDPLRLGPLPGLPAGDLGAPGIRRGGRNEVAVGRSSLERGHRHAAECQQERGERGRNADQAERPPSVVERGSGMAHGTREYTV